MKKLLGRFYFKRTINGNLLGEYSNSDSNCKRSYAEAANVIASDTKASTDSLLTFVGSYHTVWHDEPYAPCAAARLEITAKQNCTNLFLVSWKDIGSGAVLFTGEAMLCDDILVGDYQSP